MKFNGPTRRTELLPAIVLYCTMLLYWPSAAVVVHIELLMATNASTVILILPIL